MTKEEGRMYTEGEQLTLTAHGDVPNISFVRSFVPMLRNSIRATGMSFRRGSDCSEKMCTLYIVKE